MTTKKNGGVPIRVTDWDEPTDKDTLSWFEWFKNRNVSAAVVRRASKVTGAVAVSVWRIGKDEDSSRDPLKERYEIVKECHGFSRRAGLHDAT